MDLTGTLVTNLRPFYSSYPPLYFNILEFGTLSPILRFSVLSPNLLFSLQIGNRGSIRERYRIKGGSFGDCCTVFCCSPCELTQESRELDLEEQSFPGFKR